MVHSFYKMTEKKIPELQFHTVNILLLCYRNLILYVKMPVQYGEINMAVMRNKGALQTHTHFQYWLMHIISSLISLLEKQAMGNIF